MPAIAPQILKIAKRTKCNVFIESGTWIGHSFQKAIKSGIFERCYTVEIVPRFYKTVTALYKTRPSQQVFLGKSHEVFQRRIFPLCSSKDRIFFWLDGHHSGGVTWAGGTGGRDSPCPLLAELKAIHKHCPSSSLVIAIDDADDFGRVSSKVPGHNWPTRAEIDAAAYRINPNFASLDYTGGGSLQKIYRGVLVFSYQIKEK